MRRLQNSCLPPEENRAGAVAIIVQISTANALMCFAEQHRIGL